MLTVSRVVEGTSGVGDGSVLQPAATLSPEVRAQLFDEFATSPESNGVGSDTMGRPDSVSVSVVLLAIALGALTFFILRYVAKEKTN